jgi:hypothetical protein
MLIDYKMQANNSMQRGAASHSGCKRPVLWLPSLSLVMPKVRATVPKSQSFILRELRFPTFHFTAMTTVQHRPRRTKRMQATARMDLSCHRRVPLAVA